MKPSSLAPKLAWLMAGTAFLAATPGLSQPEPEEIIITGRYGRLPDSVRSASAAVSYADLDLSTGAGRRELRRRVSLTARFLCDRLGETDVSSAVVPSCRDAATRDALQRVGTVEAGFAPRGTAWVRGPAWAPPYPRDWEALYFDPDRTYAPCGSYRLDANGDGRVSNAEYSAYRAGAYSAWDTNRDGRISRSEYANCWYGGGFYPTYQRPMYEPSWSAFDANNDGFLSADEYWSATSWTRLDRNGDGVVDRTEWPW